MNCERSHGLSCERSHELSCERSHELNRTVSVVFGVWLYMPAVPEGAVTADVSVGLTSPGRAVDV